MTKNKIFDDNFLTDPIESARKLWNDIKDKLQTIDAIQIKDDSFFEFFIHELNILKYHDGHTHLNIKIYGPYNKTII